MSSFLEDALNLCPQMLFVDIPRLVTCFAAACPMRFLLLGIKEIDNEILTNENV